MRAARKPFLLLGMVAILVTGAFFLFKKARAPGDSVEAVAARLLCDWDYEGLDPQKAREFLTPTLEHFQLQTLANGQRVLLGSNKSLGINRLSLTFPPEGQSSSVSELNLQITRGGKELYQALTAEISEECDVAGTAESEARTKWEMPPDSFILVEVAGLSGEVLYVDVTRSRK